MAADKHGYFGFEPGDDNVESHLFEVVIDNLIRIAEMAGMELDQDYFESWNDDDIEEATNNWTSFWTIIGEYVMSNSTTITPSDISSSELDDSILFADIFHAQFGFDFLTIPDNRETYFLPNSDLIDELRSSLAEFNHSISESVDESPVPEFDVTPQISEVEFSGFIKGEPKATWTIHNLMDNLNDGKLVFPSWQRKSDAWSEAKKQNLIRSLLLRIPLPSIIIHERNDGTREVVDGRQRISALREFFSGQFKTAKFDQNTLLNKTGALPTDASGIEFFGNKYWNDMLGSTIRIDENRTKAIEDWMTEQVVPSLEFSGLTDEQLYYIFTVFNISCC